MVQYPEEIGKLVIQTVKEYFVGKTVKPVIKDRVGVYTGSGLK